MAFKVPFIQINRCLTGTAGVGSYTISETKKVGREAFASILLARYN